MPRFFFSFPVGDSAEHSSRAHSGGLTNRLRAFRRDEDGALIVFTLYILLCMMLAIGLAIDTARFEYARTKLQSTLDRAVLAAADLDQVLTADAVVEDYFKKAGLEEHLVKVDVDEGFNYRTVSANSSADLNTIFVDMVGIDTLSVPAMGAANETLADVEISLVLDNSGSMGNNSNLRLNLLKPAAKDFIDAVSRDAEDTNTASISIIPFATQVSVGEDLWGYFNTTDDHDYSRCVTFSDSDFNSIDISQTAELRQTGHFDPTNKSWTMQDKNAVCSTYDSREITPWSTDAEFLKGRIDAMTARGWTSIELGAKWGAALLNPNFSNILTSMADKGLVEDKLRGQPFSYTRDGTMKVLVVMSDGENTNQWDLKDGYRNGNSPVYYDSGSSDYTYYYNRSGSYDYWHEDRDSWYYYPDGSNPKIMTWPEVFADMTVENFTDNIKADAIGGYGSTYESQIMTKISSSTKNTRTKNVCDAAKAAGVTIFTIGMDTYGQGDATLSDCASAPTYFYDVRSLDISVAFAAIARQINYLRLTQ